MVDQSPPSSDTQDLQATIPADLNLAAGKPAVQSGMAGNSGPSRTDLEATITLPVTQTGGVGEPATVDTSNARGHQDPGSAIGLAPTISTHVEQATVLTRPADPNQTSVTDTPDRQGTASTNPRGSQAGGEESRNNYLAQTGGATGTGALSRSGFTTRAGRTRINLNLPADAQALDVKLQMSRSSVLSEIATVRQAHGNPLPPAIMKLVETQGTVGRYAIDKQIAAGGMGAVLKIDDHDFRRPAAMKIIRAQMAHNSEFETRFLAEAQITAQLEHPNIVPIHDLGVMDDGTMYFTMTLIQGVSLGKVVKLLRQHRGLEKHLAPTPESEAATKKWTQEEKILAFLKVLDGVGFAHDRGVIHRDLKPDNVMIGLHGEVLVVDWGIAKVLTEAPTDATLVMGAKAVPNEAAQGMTQVGATMGTLHYMPPEQAKGLVDEIDRRSDVYALGATLYELLSLERCLNSKSVQEGLLLIIQGQWTRLNLVAPDLHPDLVAIVHKAMALLPEKRYQDCAAFGVDLRRYLQGQAVDARRRSITDLIVAWARQHWKQLAIGAGAVALIAGTIVVTMHFQSQHRRTVGEAALAEANAAWSEPATSDEGRQASLKKAETALAKAELNLPGNRDVALRSQEVANALGQVSARLDAASKARLAAEAREGNIAAALDRAKKAKDDGEYRKALEQCEVAQGYGPTSTEQKTAVNKLRDELVAIISNAEKAERLRLAKAALEQARKGIELAAATDPVQHDNVFNGLIHQAKVDVNVANAEGLAEAPKLAERIGDLLRKAGSARNAASNRTSAEGHLDHAERELDAADAALAKKPVNHAEAGNKADAALVLLEKATGLDAGNSRLGRLRSAIATRAEAAQHHRRREAAEVLCARAGKALEAEALDQATELAANALNTAPEGEAGLKAAINAVRDRIEQKKQAAERQRRLAKDVEDAQRLATDARKERAELGKVRDTYVQVKTKVATLERELAGLPSDRIIPLFAARAEEVSLRQQVAERWANTESLANQALARLAEQPELELARELRGLLAEIYYLRLGTARAERAQPEIKAYTNLIRRLFANRPAAEKDVWERKLEPTGELVAKVPAGTVLVPLDQNPQDLRLIPLKDATAKPIPNAEPQRLPAGAWQLRREDQVVTVIIPPDGRITLTWPDRLPTIAGHALRWVPPDPANTAAERSGKGFMLGDSEVTFAQYLGFLNEPDQLERIRECDIKAAEMQLKGNNAQAKDYVLVPRSSNGDLYVERIKNADGLTGLKPKPQFDQVPVYGINRIDAEAFCTWLGKRSKLKIRLPLASERIWAAQGGDPRRLWPWGEAFVPGYAGDANTTQKDQAWPWPVAGHAFDIGPFGHHDLGGNAREWLGDDNRAGAPQTAGPHGALVAGGSWSDDGGATFRGDYKESLSKESVSPAIGFRILVEIP